MENREWLNDYQTLKQVNANNPFTVPDGYFNELGQRITSAIKLDELKNSMPLTGFTVPENYFEQLNGNIQSRINIENAVNTDHGFTVPENYFEQLSGNIQSRINVEHALSMKTTGLTVPENYFEQLNSRIQSRIRVEEALVNSADAFTVPLDYFAGLNKNIRNKTVNQDLVKHKKGVVVRLFSSAAFKYATAACLALMIGTGIFIKQTGTNTAVHSTTLLHKELSAVPLDDIQNYLELNVEDTQRAVATGGLAVDDADLNDALQNYINSPQ
ncbi:MAG TPA: hypothetical protein VGC01_10490 [Mucilaginibacter sp.]